jgi:hypothetical protein
MSIFSSMDLAAGHGPHGHAHGNGSNAPSPKIGIDRCCHACLSRYRSHLAERCTIANALLLLFAP